MIGGLSSSEMIRASWSTTVRTSSFVSGDGVAVQRLDLDLESGPGRASTL